MKSRNISYVNYDNNDRKTAKTAMPMSLLQSRS